MNGSNVGELTSAGYSRVHGRAVAMGYVRSDRVLTDDTLLAAHYQIDIAGELFAATPHVKLSSPLLAPVQMAAMRYSDT